MSSPRATAGIRWLKLLRENFLFTRRFLSIPRPHRRSAPGGQGFCLFTVLSPAPRAAPGVQSVLNKPLT